MKIIFPNLLDHLSEPKKRMMLSYPFVKIFIEGDLDSDTFLDNLKSFEADLIKKGLSKQKIETIRNVALQESTYRKIGAEIERFRQKSLSSPQEGKIIGKCWENMIKLDGMKRKKLEYTECQMSVLRFYLRFSVELKNCSMN